MNTFFAGIKGMVADSHNNSISSKRIVVFMCVIMMVVGFVANVFYGVEVAEHIYTSIMMVVLVGVGLTGAEKFAQHSDNTGACTSSDCCRKSCFCRQRGMPDCCDRYADSWEPSELGGDELGLSDEEERGNQSDAR